ncbi:MAG TPA: DinB family protein [Candidatus Dormibacteraeota bacterium]
MDESLLVEAFRYNRWANLHVLDVCAKLGGDQLQLTTPGTSGTLAATLLHLLSAEQRYLRRLVGHEPKLNEKDAFPGVAALRAIAERSGDQLIEVAGRMTGGKLVETQYGDRTFKIDLGVVLIQAMHHGNDHRTHVCTILGAHGIEYSDMDVWAYGEATGAMLPLGAG